MVRQLSCKQQVIGSSPIRGSTQKVAAPQRKLRCRHFLCLGANWWFVGHSVGHFFRYRSVTLEARNVRQPTPRERKPPTVYLLSTYCNDLTVGASSVPRSPR